MADGRFNTRRGLALTLAAVGGFIDAVSFLRLFGLFAGQMSGNTIVLGVQLGRGEGVAALTRAVPIVVFVIAVAFGVAWLDARPEGRTRRGAPLLLTEAAIVIALMSAGIATRDAGTLHFESAAFYLLAVLAVSAMGLQTAVLRDVAGAPVRTTFVTGMLTHLSEDAVAWVRARGASDTATLDAVRTRVGLHGGIWGTYLAGAVAGGFVERHWHFWALLLPALVLAGLAAAFANTARAR